MLRITRKNIWHDRDSNPKPTAWERCCPNPTAIIYFWIKRVGSFGLKKKEKGPYWINNFSCILHILRKIIKRNKLEPCKSAQRPKLPRYSGQKLFGQKFQYLLCYTFWKEQCVLETGSCLVFYPVHNLHYLTSSLSNHLI